MDDNQLLSKDLEPVIPPKENRKRKREIFTVALLCILFLGLTWAEFHLIGISKKLPFVHSVFFFGLVNFNMILLLFLLFLIFRNVVKIFVERQGRLIGASLKGKLVAAFVAFSFVPTALMFAVSVFYINSSFDKWFSVKMAGVLKDSLEVTNAYYSAAKKKNYHFAHQVASSLDGKGERRTEINLKQLREIYSLDAVEFYPNLFGQRIISVAESESVPTVPPVSLEFLQKGIVQKIDASTVHHFGEGNLIRVIVPLKYSNSREEVESGAIVVSSFVPMSLISKMNDIASVYDDFKDLNPLEYPLKSIYLIILVLMTLVILFAATWLGFHLARQLSTPLESLAQAARRVARGKYNALDIRSGSAEINQLVNSFNLMTKDLEAFRKELVSKNESLKSHSRYIEVVLSNVSAGVVSLDPDEVITTMNQHAGKLLRVEPESFIGKRLRDVLSIEDYEFFLSLTSSLQQFGAQSIQKEIRPRIKKETLHLQLTLTLLLDENEKQIGVVVVFDDLSVLVNAQRAAAWREVARRIAHEIKNPLTPIKLSAERLEKKFGGQISDPVFSGCVQMIVKQVDELRDMVNEFSNFARLPQAHISRNSLNQCVDESLLLYKTAHKEISFETVLDAELIPFDFDFEQIRRVMTNLLENSIAAFEETQSSRKINVSTQFDRTLGIARLVVEDNGVGVSEEVKSRIFEPYFSTKTQGTGLGLSIVKRIIDDHNGFIRVYSVEPQGSRFVIELPVLRQGYPGTVKLEESHRNK
jgi:two-component system nitrogen regulation sensor histidine kinase NtrY